MKIGGVGLAIYYFSTLEFLEPLENSGLFNLARDPSLH